jgi:hypothetical protein
MTPKVGKREFIILHSSFCLSSAMLADGTEIIEAAQQ